MSWQELRRSRGGRGAPNGVRVSFRKHFQISLGKDLCAEIGLKARDKVSLLLGAGEHAGRLRIIKDPDGQYAASALSQNSETLKIQRNGLPGMRAEPHKGTIVEFARTEGGIEIKLPAWALPSASATRPLPPPAAKPAPQPPRAVAAVESEPARPPGHPSLPAAEVAQRENRLVHAISECYRNGINPSYADLSRLAGIPNGSIGQYLAKLTKESRITRDEHGIRPRGQPALHEAPKAATEKTSGDAKERACLKCGAKFKSEWAGNRLCRQCGKSSNPAAEGVAG